MADYDYAVNRGKAEIRRDIAEGTVPPTVASFAELHDYVDANYYGGAFDDYEPYDDDGQPDEVADFWSEVQEQLNSWIKAGRP